MAGIFRVDVDVNAEPDNKLVSALVRGVSVRLLRSNCQELTATSG